MIKLLSINILGCYFEFEKKVYNKSLKNTGDLLRIV